MATDTSLDSDPGRTPANEPDPPARSDPAPAEAGRPWWAAALGAIAAGLLVGFAFPRYSFLPDLPTWWAAPVGIAAFALVVRGQRPRRGAWLGLLFGLAYFGPPLAWTGEFVGSVWLFVPASQGAFMALLGCTQPLVWRLTGRRRWLMPLLTGGLWVSVEGLRGRFPFGGFPWAKIAFSQADSPALKYASLGGTALVTFVVAVGGGLLALAVVAIVASDRRETQSGNRLVQPLTMVGVAIALLAAGLVIPIPAPTGPRTRIAVVQGNVPRLGLDFNAQRRAVLDNHVRATLALAARVSAGKEPRPDVVIWPENSSDISPLENPDAADEITIATRAVGAPILVGTLTSTPSADQLYNLGLVWDPRHGPGQRYAKVHPLPFAEYLPWRETLMPIAKFFSDDAKLIGRFAPGDRPGVMKVGPVTLGDVICFEVAFDAETRASMDNGRAQLVAVQTNNATFGLTAESAQQLAMVRLRAVEYGRPAVMASTTGSSAIIGYDGAIHQRTPLFSQHVLTETVQLGAATDPTVTLAARLGSSVEWVLVGLTLGGLLTISWLGRRGRGGPRPVTGGADGERAAEPASGENESASPNRT